MDWLKGIGDLIKIGSSTVRATILFIVVIVVGIFVFVKINNKPAKKSTEQIQCDYLIEQNRLLVNSLLDIRKNINEIIQPTSYIETNRDYFIFASYDTIPHNQEQQKLKSILRRIDSILIRQRLDSLQRAKKHSKG